MMLITQVLCVYNTWCLFKCIVPYSKRNGPFWFVWIYFVVIDVDSIPFHSHSIQLADLIAEAAAIYYKGILAGIFSFTLSNHLLAYLNCFWRLLCFNYSVCLKSKLVGVNEKVLHSHLVITIKKRVGVVINEVNKWKREESPFLVFCN